MDLLPLQSKLAAAGQTQQQLQLPAVLPGHLAQQVVLGHGLHGADHLLHIFPAGQLLHPLGVLIYAGDHILLLLQAKLAADGVLPGGADLQPLYQSAHLPGQEGVGLHRIAQGGILRQDLPQVGHPALQRLPIKEIEGSGKAPGQLQKFCFIHAFRLLSAVLCGRSFHFWSAGTFLPPSGCWAP